MYQHSFRNSVVGSTFTLPVMAVITLVVWLLPHGYNVSQLLGLAMTSFTAYCIMELNNRNALLRVRSRLMSVTYLAFMTACPALHAWSVESVAATCLVLAYFMLFSSYQEPKAQGRVFHAFLCVGLGSLAYPPVVVLALVYYVSMVFFLRCFTWRSFVAGVLGLAVPYWFYAAWAIWNNSLDSAFVYLEQWQAIAVPCYEQLTLCEMVTAGTLLFFTLLSFIHFFRTVNADKMRTRMLLFTVTAVQVAVTAGLLGLPNHFHAQMYLFVANSAIMVAHYYAVARGNYFNVWFNLSLLVLCVLGAFNYYVSYMQ